MGTTREAEADEQCGIGPCRPTGMQGCAKLIVFTVIFALISLVTYMQPPLMVSQVPSIERHFDMTSTQVGVLMSANEIGFVVMILVVSHLGKDSHIPRLIGGSVVVLGVCAIVIGLLNFVHPHSLEESDVIASSSTTSNQTSSQSDKYLCVPDARNRTFDAGCSSSDAPVGNLTLVVIFGLLLAIQGVCKAVRSPLGVAYIDNNVSDLSKSGLYIGFLMTVLLFGPPIGLAIGGAISKIPVDLSETTLNPLDPRWVGAWWIGFFVCGALVILTAIPMLFVPKRMPVRRHGNQTEKYQADGETGEEKATSGDETKSQSNGKAVEEKNDAEKNASGNAAGSEAETQSTTFVSMIRELPRSLLRLIKNPVYVLLIFGFGVQVFAVLGFSSFLIKFVLFQFNLAPDVSSYVFGLSNLAFSGLGTFVGGALVSCANLTRRGCLRWVLFAGTVSAVLSAISLGLGCDSPPIVGLQHSRRYVLDDGLTSCECDVTQFLPVCSGNQTFLSPCHAGCIGAANATHFSNCSVTAETTAKVGPCSSGCDLMIPFIVVEVLSGAFSATTVTPIYITILRSVKGTDKSLGLGLMSFVLSLVGFIPGPIASGAVIDSACLIWTKACGAPGACALYDITRFRHGYIGLELGSYVFALLLFLLALLVLTWQIRTNRTTDDKPTQEKEVEGSGGKSKGQKMLEMMRF